MHNNSNNPFQFLHVMLRVEDLDKSVHFYTELCGMRVLRRIDDEINRFTLIYLGYGEESDSTVLELTHNWDGQTYDKGTAYGHIALAAEDIYKTCDMLKSKGVNIIRDAGPVGFDENTLIAFAEDPDGYKVELIQWPRP